MKLYILHFLLCSPSNSKYDSQVRNSKMQYYSHYWTTSHRTISEKTSAKAQRNHSSILKRKTEKHRLGLR